MPACVVHLDGWADTLARGMSWPLRTSDVVAAFAARPESEIWLSVSRRDKAKEWARAERAERAMAGVELVDCHYEARNVEFKADRAKRSSRPPAWFGLDDPPIVSCWVSSLPAKVMREAGLTKVVAAATFARAFATLGPTSGERITVRDWRITLLLDAREKRLISRLEHRPAQKWTKVKEEFTVLEAEE